MEATKILTANFLDILFEGRNKEYGAYELRNTYEKRMWKALGITTAIFLAIAGIMYLKTAFAEPTQKITMSEYSIIDIKAIPDEKPKDLSPPPPLKKIVIPKVQTIKLTTPVVVDNHKVTEPPPTQTDMADARISIATQEGVKYTGTVVPPEVIDDNKGIAIAKKNDDNGGRPFEKVEIDAKYPGGASAWRNFLERNLRGEMPVNNGATPGTYTVIIQFVVDKGGNVSDIKLNKSWFWDGGRSNTCDKEIRKMEPGYTKRQRSNCLSQATHNLSGIGTIT